jgi:hypothetical protein
MYRVVEQPGRGKLVIAVQDLLPGQLLMDEAPLFISRALYFPPSTKRQETCSLSSMSFIRLFLLQTRSNI